jgi:hypothetical protein
LSAHCWQVFDGSQYSLKQQLLLLPAVAHVDPCMMHVWQVPLWQLSPEQQCWPPPPPPHESPVVTQPPTVLLAILLLVVVPVLLLLVLVLVLVPVLDAEEVSVLPLDVELIPDPELLDPTCPWASLPPSGENRASKFCAHADPSVTRTLTRPSCWRRRSGGEGVLKNMESVLSK